MIFSVQLKLQWALFSPALLRNSPLNYKFLCKIIQKTVQHWILNLFLCKKKSPHSFVQNCDIDFFFVTAIGIFSELSDKFFFNVRDYMQGESTFDSNK